MAKSGLSDEMSTQISDDTRLVREAARAGDVQRVRRLVERGAHPNWTDMNERRHQTDGCDSCTALMLASQGGHLDVVSYLLSHGDRVIIDQWAPSHLHPSSLQFAARGGHLAVCEQLVTHGASPGIRNDLDECHPDSDYSPLETALFMPPTPGPVYEDIACLLARGYRSDYSRRRTTRDRSIFRRELAVGRSVSLLQAAVENGYGKFAAVLLERDGLEGEQGLRRARSLLVPAAAAGLEGVVRALLERGAGGSSGEHGVTALHAAAACGHDGVLRLLLDAGADVEAREGHSGTPLQAACAGGYEKAVQVLLDAGADMDVWSEWYDTPLEEAMYGEHEAVIALLTRKLEKAAASQLAIK